MKKVILLGAILIVASKSTFAQIQSKPTYTLESVPCYDEFGTYYGVVKHYDHLPTSQDSLQFRIDSKKELYIMMDSVRRVLAPKPAKKTYPRKNK